MHIPKYLCPLLAVVLLCTFATGAPAAEERHGTHHRQDENPRYPVDYKEIEPAPEETKGIRKYAMDDDEGPQKNFGLAIVHDNEPFATFMADRLEYQTKEGDPIFIWDVQATFGGDYNTLYIESEAERLIEEDSFEELSLEVFYGRTITSFWDFKAGIRHDFDPDPERTFGAIGFEGLAPYWFETEFTAYVSEDGDISAALEFEYDLLLTQRLILQPRLEAGIAAHDVEEFGIGQGLTGYEAGLRLRYEFTRKFAPYVGFSWSQKTGETGANAKAEGEDPEAFSFVAGLRVWL